MAGGAVNTSQHGAFTQCYFFFQRTGEVWTRNMEYGNGNERFCGARWNHGYPRRPAHCARACTTRAWYATKDRPTCLRGVESTWWGLGVDVAPSWSPVTTTPSTIAPAPAPSTAAPVVVKPGFFLALAFGCFLRYVFYRSRRVANDGSR